MIGKVLRLAGKGEDDLNILGGPQAIQRVYHLGKGLKIASAHLKDGVDVNVGDIIVAGQQPGDEAINSVIARNGVFIGINQACSTADLIGQADILFDDDNLTLALLYSFVGHFHYGLGLTAALVSYD